MEQEHSAAEICAGQMLKTKAGVPLELPTRLPQEGSRQRAIDWLKRSSAEDKAKNKLGKSKPLQKGNPPRAIDLLKATHPLATTVGKVSFEDVAPGGSAKASIPKSAPEFYNDRSTRSETGPEFVRRVYGSYLDLGFSRAILKKLDPPAMKAVLNWEFKHNSRMSDLLSLPEVNDRLLSSPEVNEHILSERRKLRELNRLNAAAHRRQKKH